MVERVRGPAVVEGVTTRQLEPGQDAGVSSRLSKGMRAFAIRVDVATGVSGFLRPGDRVDVYWSGTIQGRLLTNDMSGLSLRMDHK